MKKTLLLIGCFLVFSYLHAQDKLTAFGKPDKTELALRDCDFDPGEPLECLVDMGEVTYSVGATVMVETQIRKKFKIYKESGISIANVKVGYYSKDGYENISNVEGYVYNTDSSGNIIISKLKKSEVYDKKLDDKYSEISFALPDVRVGSVIEYRYISYRKSFWNIRSWYFQQKYPVKYSAYNLVIPDYFNFTYQVNRRQELTIKKSSDQDGNWFVMRNIASIHDEPYMSGENDYLQRVDFNLTSVTPPGEATIEVGTNWDKQMQDYLDEYDAGGQLKKNIHHPEDLDAQLAGCKTDKDKLAAIYRYVQKNMKCTNDEGFYCENGGVKDAWDKRQGTVADINFLLINWLRDYKVSAHPLLVSTHENGAPNPSYVDMGQFNAVMVYVQIDSTPYVLNAADKYAPFDMIPSEINFSSALVADEKHSHWIKISDTRKRYASQGIMNLNIAANGKISGFANLIFHDYARVREMENVEKGNVKSRFNIDKNIDLSVDSFHVENEESDSLPLNINLNVSGVARNSGNYLLIPYNLYSGMSENPFTADNRKTSVQFGVLRSFSLTGYINIDDGLVFDALPKSISMRIMDSSILVRRIFQKNSDRTASFLLSIYILRPTYSLDEYSDIKAFYKQLFTLLDERIVVKRAAVLIKSKE